MAGPVILLVILLAPALRHAAASVAEACDEGDANANAGGAYVSIHAISSLCHPVFCRPPCKALITSHRISPCPRACQHLRVDCLPVASIR